METFRLHRLEDQPARHIDYDVGLQAATAMSASAAVAGAKELVAW